MSLVVQQLTHVYQPGTPWSARALVDVNLTIEAGDAVAIVGGTGSGKSTLVQHFNGLLKPTSGRVLYKGQDIWRRGYNQRRLRQQVALAFQFAERQLFETSVADDIAFGPRQLGLDQAEVKARVDEAMAILGLPPSMATASPFSLSGGQMRRVALAGIMALQPPVLILDEPTAGLDPAGRQALIQLVADWHRQGKRTLILVSHNMDEVAQIARRVVVMQDGQVVGEGPTETLFSDYDLLHRAGLDLPSVTRIMQQLRQCGWNVPAGVTDLDTAGKHIIAEAARKTDA